MIDLVSFGIIVDDIVTWRGEMHMGVLGGGGPQTCWGMACALGSGGQVGLSAGIGLDTDPSLLNPLRAAGVDLTGVRVSAMPTPRAWQLVEADDRRTQVWRVPEAVITDQLRRAWDVLPTAYQQAEAFHWGIHVEHQPPDFAESLIQMKRQVSLEAFRAPERPLSVQRLARLAHACTIFSCTDLEAIAITGHTDIPAITHAFRSAGSQLLVLRQGASGSLLCDLTTQETVHVPSVMVDPVDVTGAGNAYGGALLARLADGLREAACHAATVASYVIEQVGLPPHLPDRSDYQARFDTVWRSCR